MNVGKQLQSKVAPPCKKHERFDKSEYPKRILGKSNVNQVCDSVHKKSRVPSPSKGAQKDIRKRYRLLFLAWSSNRNFGEKAGKTQCFMYYYVNKTLMYVQAQIALRHLTSATLVLCPETFYDKKREHSSKKTRIISFGGAEIRAALQGCVPSRCQEKIEQP